MCAPFLSSGSKYYQTSEIEFVDNFPPERAILGALQLRMTAKCASNTLQLACNAIFKKCAEVDDPASGGKTWIPALVCEDTCERNFDVWEQCKRSIENDDERRVHFQAYMLEISSTFHDIWGHKLFDYGHNDTYWLQDVVEEWSPFRHLDCRASANKEDIAVNDGVLSYIFGQWSTLSAYPPTDEEWPDEFRSWEFPPGMDTARLYPTSSSKYTREDDGQVFDIPCYSLGPTPISYPECGNYVNNPDPWSWPPCVKTCPVQAFDDDEYSTLFLVYMVPSSRVAYTHSITQGRSTTTVPCDV